MMMILISSFLKNKKFKLLYLKLILFFFAFILKVNQVQGAPEINQNLNLPLGIQIPSFYASSYNTDGSIDFIKSGWTKITQFNDPADVNSQVNWQFIRNHRNYKIISRTILQGRPLSSFKVYDNTDPNNITSYTYVYGQGGGTTSYYVNFSYPSLDSGPNFYNLNLDTINDSTSAKYTKKSKYGNAIAVTGKTSYGNTSPISEIVDVTPDGLIQHYITYTEKSAKRYKLQMGSLRDTELIIYDSNGWPQSSSPGDSVDIHKGPGSSVYVSASSTSKPNILLNANIHYIDVSGKNLPSGGWNPSDGIEINDKKQIISVQKSDLSSDNKYPLNWNHDTYKAVNASPEINIANNTFSFPNNIIDNAIKTDFRVYFDGPIQYGLNWRNRYSYNTWKNANSFNEDDLISIEAPNTVIDSAVVSTDSIPALDKDQSFTVAFTEGVVSSGELSENNTGDYYVYLQKLGKTSLRAVPNFDFGVNQVKQSNNYFLANSVLPPTQTNLNLDYKLDNKESITGNPIQNYLINSNGTIARALVITDSQALTNTNWRLEASLSKFIDGNNAELNSAIQPKLTFNPNKMTLKGIDDTGTPSSDATWRKSVNPVIATQPVMTADSPPATIITGQNGNSSAIGSWLVDFGNSQSVTLNFPVKGIKNNGINSQKLKSTVTWTLITATP